ncbi:MAG TPA: hypothetical protein VJS91_07900 [Nitrososphaeraceae archaeon]|nr:hypothetical protein [Nitrososphaeraceae archaeon]
MDIRIYLIGIAFIVVLSGGTGVLAQSNTTGNNNTDVGSAAELAELTSNNSFANLTDMTTFNDTGANLTSNQSQTTNQTTTNQTSNISG